MKYKGSTINDSRYGFNPLVASLISGGINITSGSDTRLQGTYFKSLYGTTISVGEGAKLILEGVVNTNTVSTASTANSTIWQSMSGNGTTSQTLTLPRFEGPVAPVFSAPGGMSIQVPAGNLQAEVTKLSTQPGYEYLKPLLLRKDIDWQPVKLIQDSWSYEKSGLTPAAAALLSIAVAAVLPVNLGANLLGSAGFSGSVLSPLGAMANAAAAGLPTQAAVALASNKGNISAALNDLSSSATVKQLLTSALTAGALSKVLTMPGMESLGTVTNDPAFMERLVGRLGTSLVESTVSATVDTAINGGSLTDKLDFALINGLANALQGTVAGEIKGLESGSLDTDYVLHKIAHAAAGCVAGEITQKACEAGAIGASYRAGIANGSLIPPAELAAKRIWMSEYFMEQLAARNSWVKYITTGK